MSNDVPAGKLLFLDELHSCTGDDALREKLRSVDGVPAVSYQVQGEKVFVFEKLVQLVKQNGHNLTAVADLVSQATMSAAEAVEEWSVFPEPYSREIDTTGQSQVICHRYLNAHLPRKYPDRDACNADAARLLLGHPVDGEGDFTYREQSMVLREPFTLDRLPPRPDWVVPTDEDPGAYTHLWNTDFVSGFAPITESLFIGVKSAEWEWNHAIAATCAYMGNPECIASMWLRTGELNLEQLELKPEDVDELDPEHYLQFQILYPELAMLSPAAIQQAYDEYCESMWEYPERSEGFLFYLIGSTVSKGKYRYDPEQTGRLTAHALLTGASIEDACSFGSEVQRFDTALSGLAYQVSVAMKFIATDTAAAGKEGHPVSTLSDTFRLMRKANINTLTATQKYTGKKNQRSSL